MFVLSTEHKARFAEDGFVIVPEFLGAEEVERAAERFEPLFRGQFETGLYPDEWNWRGDRDAPDLTRQICNGWKSDRTIASVVLREEIGRTCAELMDWNGARICQDNVLWKPPGAKALGYHQDDSYQDWTIPGAMITCWIALDDTRAEGGALEHVRGSHCWDLAPPAREFHAPAVYDAEMRAAAARADVTPDIVPIVVESGAAVFHHGRLWHGSAENRSDQHRRALVSHCIPANSRFHPRNVGYIYSRYKRVGDDTMDESFFPILWTRDGGRSAFLENYLA